MVNPVLAAARSEGLCAMQVNLPSSRGGQNFLRHEIKSHPDTYLLDSDGAVSVCRICWGEEDDDEGETKKKNYILDDRKLSFLTQPLANLLRIHLLPI
jgi:hypothetical protein